MKIIKTIIWSLTAVLLAVLGLAWYGNSLKDTKAKSADIQTVVSPIPKPEEAPVADSPAPKLEKEIDFTMTPNELVKAEHKNKARFIRDIVGKNVKITGKVKNISESFFSFEAKESLSGDWTVYGKDSEFLANLDAGEIVTIVCEIEDAPLIGGASRCTD